MPFFALRYFRAYVEAADSTAESRRLRTEKPRIISSGPNSETGMLERSALFAVYRLVNNFRFTAFAKMR